MDELYNLVEEQISIIAIPIMLMLRKSIEYSGEDFSYNEDEQVAKVITEMFLSARSSSNTVVRISKFSDMSSKDCLPIARAVIEGCINITFIMSKGSSAAEDAVAHSITRGYKKTDISAGSGRHKLSLQRIPQVKRTDYLTSILERFTSKKGRSKNWTDFSVPQRINFIESVFGNKCASGFNAAYLMIYGDASEIVHGSLAGAQIGNGTIPFGKPPKDFTDDNSIQKEHVKSALISIYIAIHNALYAFCKYTNFEKFEDKLDSQFQLFTDYVRTDSNWA